MLRHIQTLVLAAALGLATPSFAQDTEATEAATPEQGSSSPAETVEDRFALDPAVAFEAFAAGNYPRAFDLAITFANRGHAPSMRLMGQMYATGLGVDADAAEAAEWYRVAAEAGDAEAAFLLATMIMDGAIVERDEAAAAELLQSAHDAGFAPALQMLAMMTLEGRGVERDLIGGAEMMREAAVAGDTTAQYTLGILYAEGAGVRQDTEESYRWFERAARRGNVEAQIEFGLGLLTGAAGEADLSEERRIEDGIFWLRRAAESGNPLAHNRLAHAYTQGYGVPLDPVMAAYHHSSAVAGGLPDARLDAFVSTLSDEQRRAAQDRVALDTLPPNPFN